MLQRIRDNASGPLAYVVVAVIALVFGVWGIGSYFTPSSDPVVASVSGQDIVRSRLQGATQQLQQREAQRNQRLKQMSNGQIDLPRTPLDQLRNAALQRLIDDTVMTAYADDAGYHVADAAVLSALRNDGQFQQDGEFSAQRYRALLSQAGIPAAQYEASVRQDLKSRQLRSEVVNSAFASPAEVDQAYRLANQERQVRYLTFSPADYEDNVQVSDADIQSYYDDNAAQFQRPEQVKLSYVSLTRDNAGDGKAPDDAALRELYAQNKAQLGEPETRTGSEIRVPIEGDGAAARDAIQKLSGQTGGGDLQTLAAGVDGANYKALNAVRRADLPAAVGSALFELEPGATSAPVRADDAWYLVRLDSVTAAETPAFDDPEVQAQLSAIASAQASHDAFQEKSDQLESLAYEAPNDLKTLADDLGLDIEQTDWITAEGGPGLGQYDAVRKAAFSGAVLDDKLNSTPIQLGADRQVVLRVAEHQDAQTRPLAEVRDRIRKMLVTRKASQQARDAAQADLDKIRGGAALASVAGEREVSSPGFIKRSGDQEVDARIREAAFSVSQPGEDSSEYDISATSDGKIALIAIDAVRTPEAGGADDKRAQFADQQRSYVAEQEYAALSEYLRNQADVEINEARIN